MSKKAMRNFKSESKANKYNASEAFIKELIEDQEDELQFILNSFEREEDFDFKVLERNSHDQLKRYYAFRRQLFNNRNKNNEEFINPQLEYEDIEYCSIYGDEIIIKNKGNDFFWGLKSLGNPYDNEDIHPQNWVASMLFEKFNGVLVVEFYIEGSLDWNYQLSKKERLMVVRRAKKFYEYARIYFFKNQTIKFTAWDGDANGSKRDKFYKKISEKIGINYKSDDYGSILYYDTPQSRKKVLC
jgi:hypothetical protein